MTFDAEANDAARHEQARARAELRLLGCIAPIGRWGLALATRAGVTLETFEQPDTIAIFTALLAGERTGWIVDRTKTFLLARRALALAGLWDEDDDRTHVGGMRWGPGPLAVLFCRVNRWDAERLVPIVAREMALTAETALRGVA